MIKKKIDFSLNDADLQFLPHSKSLERKILGSILFVPDLFKTGFKYLSVKGMFYDDINAAVWDKMVLVSNSGNQPDSKNVSVEFEKEGNSELSVYANCLVTDSDIPTYFKNHCLKLNEFWIKRTLCRMGHYINQNALKPEFDALELLGASSTSTSKIFLHIAKMKEKTLEDSAKELAKDIVDIATSANGMIGIPSVLQGINRVIKGYRKGNVIVLAASTGEGKTTLALNECQNLIEQGIPVGYISLEMKTSELMLMMACRKTGVPMDKVLSGTCSPQEMQLISDYIEVIKTLPLKISEVGGLKMGEITALAKMWVEIFGIQILFIDHLHLVNSDDPSLQGEGKFTSIANDIKALAKELDIPIVELAQFNRPEKGTKRQHEITDLKYASGIEQAADVILMIYRPELHGIEEFPDGGSTEGYARILVGKLRLLKKEHIKARFTGMEFLDWDVFANNTTPVVPQEYYNPNAGFSRSSQDVKETGEPAPF